MLVTVTKLQVTLKLDSGMLSPSSEAAMFLTVTGRLLIVRKSGCHRMRSSAAPVSFVSRISRRFRAPAIHTQALVHHQA